jgi:hypothetical protein
VKRYEVFIVAVFANLVGAYLYDRLKETAAKQR